MNIGDILKSPVIKKTMNTFYSIGASVVIFGAMAKILHWKGANEILMIGMSVEVLIFFVSAFEPSIDIPDWKRVYPKLREGNEKPELVKIYKDLDEQPDSVSGKSISIEGLPQDQIDILKESFNKLSNAAKEIATISQATQVTQDFVKNLKDASLSLNSVVESNKNVFDAMSDNVKEISTSYKSAANKINTSSDEASKGIIQSSNDLTASIKITGDSFKASGEKASVGISQSMAVLSDSIKSTGENIKSSGEKASVSMSQSATELSGSIKTIATGLKGSGEKFNSDIEKSSSEFGKKLQESASELHSSYRNVANSLSDGFIGLEKSASKYIESIDKLNKNLGALNTAYEIHLKGTDKVEEVVKQYSNSVGEIGKLLHTSVEETRKFNESTKEINENIQALNKVYGRMLGALNNKK